MNEDPRSLADARKMFARQMAAVSQCNGSRLEAAFESIPREDFMPPGPWLIVSDDRLVETPDADPVHLYQNALVVLDRARGINNGEPSLHAAWLGRAGPRPGDVACHVGAGTGYYTALLATLCRPGGHVVAYEIDPTLAAAAQRNLAKFEDVSVLHADASTAALPPCDLVYVNAGVVEPPVTWLTALRLGGRLIFPWQPSSSIGLTLLISATVGGYAVEPLMPSTFIPCVGASSLEGCTLQPRRHAAWAARSVWTRAERAPDRTKVAVYRDLWFSSAPPA